MTWHWSSGGRSRRGNTDAIIMTSERRFGTVGFSMSQGKVSSGLLILDQPIANQVGISRLSNGLGRGLRCLGLKTTQPPSEQHAGKAPQSHVDDRKATRIDRIFSHGFAPNCVHSRLATTWRSVEGFSVPNGFVFHNLLLGYAYYSAKF